MPEETFAELVYQLERCEFALTTMLKETQELYEKLSHAYCYGDAYTNWPENAEDMLSDMADAIGEADNKTFEIVAQIKRCID